MKASSESGEWATRMSVLMMATGLRSADVRAERSTASNGQRSPRQNRLRGPRVPAPMNLPVSTLTETLKARALELGFDAVGITAVAPSAHEAFYRDWIAAGRHGEMQYLAREYAVHRRANPASAWPQLRSAIVVALNYYTADADVGVGVGVGAGTGIIARYARGR